MESNVKLRVGEELRTFGVMKKMRSFWSVIRRVKRGSFEKVVVPTTVYDRIIVYNPVLFSPLFVCNFVNIGKYIISK